VALIGALVVGFLYLDGLARWALIGAGVLVEVVEAAVMIWWSRRGRARVGIEALVDREGVAITDLRPDGWIHLSGERWSAVCETGCATGTRVVVTRHDGLVLHVRPVDG